MWATRSVVQAIGGNVVRLGLPVHIVHMSGISTRPKLRFSLFIVFHLSFDRIVERSRIPYYTKNLMDLRYLEKVTPLLTYRSEPERKTAYRIADPLLRFWFTFVYPHTNALERMDPRAFYSGFVAPHLDAYWGRGSA